MCKQSMYSVGKMCSFFRSFLIAITLLFSAIFPIHAQTTEGTDFWVTLGDLGELPPTTSMISQIRIVGGNRPTTGTIYFTDLEMSVPFSVPAHTIYTYVLDDYQKDAISNTTSGISNRSVHITSLDSINVYILNTVSYGNGDVTNILPTTTLDREYYHISYDIAFGESYAVVAIQNNTHLSHNGEPEIVLNKGQVYYKTSSSSAMIGAHIITNYPVAFYAYHVCAAIPTAGVCGHNMQQLAPVSNWGKKFFIPSSPATRDIIRIVVSQNNTNITQLSGGTILSASGSQTSLSNLQSGQFVEIEVSNNGCFFVADNPVGVCSFLTNYSFLTSAPAQCWVPALEQTISSARIAPFIPSGSTQLSAHYGLVCTPTDTKSATLVSIGGFAPTSLFGGSWIDNAASNMSVYSMPLTQNTASYNFTNPSGLIILCYGSGMGSSYYYPAGFATRKLSAAFTANNISYNELHNNPFCEHNITFVANIEGIHPNPGSLKWNINNVEEVNKRDSLEWSKTFATGNHIIKMSVLFEDNSTETYQDTLKIKTCEAVFYANGVLCDTLYKITFCDKVVYFQADVESPESIIWYINDPVHLSPLHVGETSWSKTYDAGEHHDFVEMVVVFENGETKTISGTVNVKVFWTSIKNIRH